MATDAQVAQARAAVYDFLAALFTYHYELDEVQERLTRRIPRVQAAVEVLRERGYHLDERGVLAAVRQITAIEDLTDLQAEHVALLDMPSPGGRSAPLESVQRHGVVHPETLAALEAFYRTFGVALAPDAEVPGDHCSVELAFMGFLAFQEAVAHGQGAGGEPYKEAQATFLRDHLLGWLPRWLAHVAERTAHPYFRAAARFARQVLEQDAELT